MGREQREDIRKEFRGDFIEAVLLPRKPFL